VFQFVALRLEVHGIVANHVKFVTNQVQ